MGTDMLKLPDIFEILIITYITAKAAISEFPTISPDRSRTSLFCLQHTYITEPTQLATPYGFYFVANSQDMIQSDLTFTEDAGKPPQPQTPAGALTVVTSLYLAQQVRQNGQGGLGRAWDAGSGPTEKEGRRRAVKSCEWFYRIS